MLTLDQRDEQQILDDLREFLKELDEWKNSKHELPGITVEFPISKFTRAELRADSARRIWEITQALETLNYEALLDAKAKGQDFF